MFLKTEFTLGAANNAFTKRGKDIPKSNLHGLINLIEQNKGNRVKITVKKEVEQ